MTPAGPVLAALLSHSRDGIVESWSRSLSRLLRDSVRLELALHAHPDRVCADRHQLQHKPFTLHDLSGVCFVARSLCRCVVHRWRLRSSMAERSTWACPGTGGIADIHGTYSIS